MLCEKVYHIEDLLRHSVYPEYDWLPQYFVGTKRPKFINVIEKLKELDWKITHQVMHEKVWLITMQTDQFTRG